MAGADPGQIFTCETIKNLLRSSTSEFTELKDCYARLPTTICKRKTHCCAILPETTLVEALWVLKRLQQDTPEVRARISRKIIAYFFINPAQITACPFLEQKHCIIYEDRFFGCRAYGLWSPQHYEQIAHQSRRAKNFLAELWRNLGISLPEAVIDFQPPYCRDVKTADGFRPSDTTLIQIAEKIESLSGRLLPWHRTFYRMYHADLSFLITSLVFDLRTALRIKVDIVRGYVGSGDRDLLDNVLQSVSDVLAPFD